jgi:aldehyde:ferredoxin oxidoreductase
MPGYHTGYGAHIGYLFGARHSHLDSAGYAIDREAMTTQKTVEELVERIIKEEQWRQILSSLVICFFAREIYTSDVIHKCLKLSGFGFSEEELSEIGREIYADKYRFKIKCGFDIDNLSLPKRVFEIPTSLGFIDKDFTDKAIVLLKEKIKSLL